MLRQYAVAQKVRAGIEGTFAVTKQGNVAVGSLHMRIGDDGAVHFYAIGKDGAYLQSGFVIDKVAGTVFLRKLALGFAINEQRETLALESELTHHKNTDLYNGERSAAQTTYRPICPACENQMGENLDGEWICGCKDKNKVG